MSTDRRGTAAGEVHQDPAELRRLRREVALRLHPDRGGDVEAFVAAMHGLEVAARPALGPAEQPRPVSVRSSARSRTRARGRRAVRGLRERLPRAVPGSRRYGRL